jgi:hypothetical protein
VGVYHTAVSILSEGYSLLPRIQMADRFAGQLGILKPSLNGLVPPGLEKIDPPLRGFENYLLAGATSMCSMTKAGEPPRSNTFPFAITFCPANSINRWF